MKHLLHIEGVHHVSYSSCIYILYYFFSFTLMAMSLLCGKARGNVEHTIFHCAHQHLLSTHRNTHRILSLSQRQRFLSELRVMSFTLISSNVCIVHFNVYIIINYMEKFYTLTPEDSHMPCILTHYINTFIQKHIKYLYINTIFIHFNIR